MNSLWPPSEKQKKMNCFTMLAKGNELKRKSEALLVVIKKLEETLKLLEA